VTWKSQGAVCPAVPTPVTDLSLERAAWFKSNAAKVIVNWLGEPKPANGS